MRWQTLACAGLLLLSAAVLSGCVGAAIENSYQDADDRVGQSFTGGYNDQKNINVPAGTKSIRVAVHAEGSGGFQLQLMANHMPKGQMNHGGVYSVKDANWVKESNPTPGTWMLQINAGGTGAFAVGVYLE
jgi:hypothetical protein